MDKFGSFDRLTELAAALFDTPVALITAVEEGRQWFRSNHGYGADQTTREESFCAHMIGTPEGSTLVVEDASVDARFRDNRLVLEDGIRFYAGAVITTADGAQDGAVCVIDTVPRPAPSAAQMDSLRVLARLVGQEIDTARLLRQQAKHTAMLEMAEDLAGLGRWRFEVSSGEIEWSDEVYRIHGQDRETFDPTYSDVLEAYNPDDREILAACVERAIQTGQGYNLELRLTNTALGERRVMARARTEQDEDGRTLALFGIFQDVTDTVNTEEKLRTTEASFRMLSETSTDIVARFDTKGRFLYVSPAVRTILGREPEDMLGSDCSAFIAQDEIHRIRQILVAHAAEVPGAASPRYEYRARKADGALVWLEATPRAIRDELGQITEYHDCVRDITAAKAAERAQQELVHTLNLAEDLAGIGSWKLDVVTGHVRWSEQVYRIYGVTPETFDPSLDHAISFYHPDDQQAVRDWCETALETGEAGELKLRLLRPDGEERIVVSRCRVERGPDGANAALFGVFQDVTESEKAEQAVRDSEARYRLLADNATDIIAIYSIDGVFKYLSPAIQDPMGYRAEELVGRAFDEFIHPEDMARVQSAFAAYARSEPGTPAPRIPYRGIRKDGSLVWLEAHPTILRDASGRPVEFQDVVRDITQTKELEQALIEARDAADAATAVKADFLANMSHELRTPLTSIIGFTGLAIDQPELGDLSRRFIERIENAGKALLCTVNDILDFSKLEAGQVSIQLQPVSIHKLATSTLELFGPQAGAKDLGLILDTRHGLEDLVLAVDPDRIRQILLNLVSNAVKFTAAGAVTLRASYAASEDLLRIEVSDTGAGISADQQGRLFKRFSQIDGSMTRAQSGTGLGLAICKGLAEAMGGRIGMSSEVGVGSTFWFEIPAQCATLPDTSALQEGPDAVTYGGVRVLVVDDHATNRELARLFLAGVGAEVSEASDGDEAVRMAAALPYDVILMDLQMPVLDGRSALRQIRSTQGPNDATPVLAFTADDSTVTRTQLRAEGFEDLVSKPVEPASLIGAVARATAFADRQEIASHAN
ncbi:PAS domain-containing protein [Brevundimonas sp.]|uniref:PAS domain-containing protein n=1 Tax=Brevundimonas sp. TaxID=1871086 RepID=UPI00286C049B|nr:PAS domain-containing protein [Brevundimonas sp.]